MTKEDKKEPGEGFCGGVNLEYLTGGRSWKGENG